MASVGGEDGRWRYRVVLNTCGLPVGQCKCGFAARSSAAIDAPKTGEVVLNNEPVVVVERRRHGGWVYLRTEKGGWLVEVNLNCGDCAVCEEETDLLRHPSCEDNTVVERATPRERWGQWLAAAGLDAAASQEGHTIQLTMSSQWIYRRGCSAALTAEQAGYWLLGDRWQYVQDDPDPGNRGDYAVAHTASPTPQVIHDEPAADAHSALYDAADWEDCVDCEGCDPSTAAFSVTVNGQKVLSMRGLEQFLQLTGARVDSMDDGPLHRAQAVAMEEAGAVVGPPVAGVETVVEACTEEKHCCCELELTTVPDVLDFDPSDLKFVLTQWHGCEDLAPYPSRLLLACVEYKGVPICESAHWDSGEGCQGGGARLVTRRLL